MLPVDNTSRVQSVDKSNKFFYSLLKEFYKLTIQGAILINTSFNIRGEPIVCTLQDALKCFYGTNIDMLVIENYIIKKKPEKRLLKIIQMNLNLIKLIIYEKLPQT